MKYFYFRRKKKCIRYMEGDEESAPGSTGSHDMSQESDSEDDSLSASLHNSCSPMERCSPSPASSSNLILSPGPSLASPSGSVSLLMPSPASPLTPGERDLFNVPSVPPPPVPVSRPPVGTNPRDVNNPLSVNQLTGQARESSRPSMVSVT